jgi:hypothetical protein
MYSPTGRVHSAVVNVLMMSDGAENSLFVWRIFALRFLEARHNREPFASGKGGRSTGLPNFFLIQ